VSAPWYSPTGTPATSAQLSSSNIRSEFTAIETALDLLPSFTANEPVVVNAGATELITVAQLPVAQGGIGVGTLTDGGVLLGSGTGAITATAVLANSEMIVGDGTTDPVLESGATLRTSIGVGTGDNVVFANITGNALIAATITGSGILSIDDATDSTSTVTGSIHTDGGLGVVKNFHVNGDLVTTDAVSTTNTKLGVGAGDVIASGALNNTAFGDDALGAITTDDDCTAIGHNALLLNTASDNTAVGSLALDANTSGVDNTAVGKSALSANTTSNSCTAIGVRSLQSSTGANNTAIGAVALGTITSGTNCTAIGTSALLLNTASDNTAVGSLALDANTSGINNTAMGKSALSAISTNSNCTAVGENALALATGGSNTAIGNNAGDSITTGSNNICIGQGTDTSTNSATNQIIIGVAIGGTANDQFSLGKASNVVSNDFGTDAIWSRISDKRKKQNVNNLNLGLDFINNLRPVTYQWKSANKLPKEWGIDPTTDIDTKTIMTGLIAQEVEQALITANTGIRFPGWQDTKQGQRISGEAYIFPIINAINELTNRLEKLEKLEDLGV